MKALRIAIQIGAVYFLAVAAAHFTGIKIPGLYVYFDIPSTEYQDKIIAFMAFGWSMAFLMGSAMVGRGQWRPFGYMLVAGGFAIGTLGLINTLPELEKLESGLNRDIFWMEWAGLLLYLAVLTFLFLKVSNSEEADKESP